MLNWFISSAHAQEAAATAAKATAKAPQAGGFMQMAPFVIIFVIFYFLMIRPQSKKIKKEQEMVAELQKGDEIYTKSGLIGKVIGLTDKIMTLELEDGSKVKFLRHMLGGKLEAVLEEKK
jgi:preprotein translocase subunit YajC